jgi:hypothetical protein
MRDTASGWNRAGPAKSQLRAKMQGRRDYERKEQRIERNQESSPEDVEREEKGKKREEEQIDYKVDSYQARGLMTLDRESWIGLW